MAEDYLRLAAVWSRQQFVAAHPFPFLVGAGLSPSPSIDALAAREPQRWGSYDTVSGAHAGGSAASGRPIAAAVRKTQDVFPDMITVGRTKNNDIVIADALMSKLHAFFRAAGAGWELTDAGSQNGTWVAGVSLVPRGPGRRVAVGDAVSFAAIELRFVDAGGFWDAARLQLSGRG